MSIKDNIKKLNFAKQPETGESLAIPEFHVPDAPRKTVDSAAKRVIS
jgi:hypothetical protein